MSKCKRWCFTDFDVATEPIFDGERFEYLTWGREICPDTQRKHLQGYVAFKNRRTLAQVKKWRPKAHFERARGTPEECAKYCHKDGDYEEFGCLPTVTGRNDKFGDVLRAAENGDIDRIKTDYPAMYIRYKSNILSSIRFSTERLSESCGVWICGPPRCGKDYSVRKLDSLYNKNLNKWWDGYRDERYVLLSDVEPSHASWLGYFLKIWTDIYPFNAEIKGGSMLIRPSKIFITSNFKLEEVFEGNILDALKCRMSIYNMFVDPPEITCRINPAGDDKVYQLLLRHEGIQTQIRPDSTTETSPQTTEKRPRSPSSPGPCTKQRPFSVESL